MQPSSKTVEIWRKQHKEVCTEFISSFPRLNKMEAILAAGIEILAAGIESLDVAAASSSVLLLVVVAAVAAFLWRHWAEYGGNSIPVYPIVGGLPALIKNRKKIYDWLSEELARCPSHTVKNMLPGGIRVVTTANPANVEHILKTNFDNYPKGDFFRSNLFDLLGNGIFNADEELWRIQRKASVQEFTTRSLRDLVMESVRGEIQTRLLPILARASREGSVVDLQDLFMRFAFDNICQLAFGVDPACLDPSLPTVAFAKAFDDATQLSTERFIVLNPLVWKIMRAFGLGSEKRLAESIKLVDEFAMFVIQKRKKELHDGLKQQQQGLGHFDLLSRFMISAERGQTNKFMVEEQQQGNVNLFSDEFLKDIVKSFLLAGRDTTSSALTYFFWLLSAHPRIEQAIREEVSQILKKRLQTCQKNAADAQNNASSFTFEELKRMNYLHAALTESMRLYPPVPVDTKYAIRDDLWPDGTAIKAGSGVAYHQFAMGRMESIWGADCMEFRPERWLNNGGEFVPESPYKYAVFQAGPRICLGKEFAYIQMKLVVAAVMSSFKFGIRRDHDAGYSFSLTLRMVNGLTATVHTP